MSALRNDLLIIGNWIQPGSRVLDLGCGDGRLLEHLRETRRVSGYGLEIDPANIVACVGRQVNVLQCNLDRGLTEFFDEDSFDYVIMTQTLQAVHFPDRLLDEMLRVGKQGIVTFPNFGHWSCRLQLLLGRMPVSRSLPAEWYSTQNIHLCTLRDFEDLCRRKHIRILQRTVVDATHTTGFGMRMLPNLLGEIALYRFERG